MQTPYIVVFCCASLLIASVRSQELYQNYGESAEQQIAADQPSAVLVDQKTPSDNQLQPTEETSEDHDVFTGEDDHVISADQDGSADGSVSYGESSSWDQDSENTSGTQEWPASNNSTGENHDSIYQDDNTYQDADDNTYQDDNTYHSEDDNTYHSDDDNTYPKTDSEVQQTDIGNTSYNSTTDNSTAPSNSTLTTTNSPMNYNNTELDNSTTVNTSSTTVWRQDPLISSAMVSTDSETQTGSTADHTDSRTTTGTYETIGYHQTAGIDQDTPAPVTGYAVDEMNNDGSADQDDDGEYEETEYYVQESIIPDKDLLDEIQDLAAEEEAEKESAAGWQEAMASTKIVGIVILVMISAVGMYVLYVARKKVMRSLKAKVTGSGPGTRYHQL